MSFIVHYSKTAFTVSYNEAAMLLHVKTPLGKGVHCTWMTVDDDTAMIYGRELLGYPKKMAHIPFNDDGNTITAGVTRRNTDVVTVKAERLGSVKETDPEPVLQTRTFNFSGMGQYYALNPVWMFKPREKIQESYKARVTIDMADSDYDPIVRLLNNHINPVEGRIVKTDIFGARMLWPVWITGPRVFKNTFNMRFR